jgi:hypothetical protein
VARQRVPHPARRCDFVDERNAGESAEQLRELVAKAGKRVALLVQRDDAQIFVPVDLG